MSQYTPSIPQNGRETCVLHQSNQLVGFGDMYLVIDET